MAVASSSMEAEYMAACAATQESLWLAMLLEQMGIEFSKPIVLKEDNQACIDFRRIRAIIRDRNISTVDIILLESGLVQAT